MRAHETDEEGRPVKYFAASLPICDGCWRSRDVHTYKEALRAIQHQGPGRYVIVRLVLLDRPFAHWRGLESFELTI